MARTGPAPAVPRQLRGRARRLRAAEQQRGAETLRQGLGEDAQGPRSDGARLGDTGDVTCQYGIPSGNDRKTIGKP